MTTLNISNPTGTKRNWMLSLTDGTVLAKAIASWVTAVDTAQGLAGENGVDTILLHKMNGSVANIPLQKRSANSEPTVKVDVAVEGDVVFMARVSKSIDHDPYKITAHSTLEGAIKALPRKAQDLVWDGKTVTFTEHTLDDGRIVSIEKTTN